jgi:hypothetical protein
MINSAQSAINATATQYPFAIAPCQAIPDCARSFRATPAKSGEISLPARRQANFPNGKQKAPRKPQRQKIVTILFIENEFVSIRRTSHADHKIDLRWFGHRPRRADGACVGEAFRTPEDRRQARPGFLVCHARQQIADGSWTEIPCQEVGSDGQTQHRSVTRNEGEETR